MFIARAQKLKSPKKTKIDHSKKLSLMDTPHMSTPEETVAVGSIREIRCVKSALTQDFMVEPDRGVSIQDICAMHDRLEFWYKEVLSSTVVQKKPELK